ncbi:MAG: zinc dependent phospholipase C family protein [Lachnospiraceae bacterium]|nr:zinc dependent phospholipase C family protein [Lachnospiraceae bacterium]
MPSRMIHYLVAEQVAERISIRDKNRFKIGSLCPDMSWRQDDSKHRTHYSDIDGDKKGINWKRYVESYSEKMKQDDLYLGVLCHLITDGIWFHEVMEPRIRSKVKSKEERMQRYQEGYLDFHRLNYILREEFGLTYELTEDRNIELDGLHLEFYDDVFDGLYRDFFGEPGAAREELTIYPYEASVACIYLCIGECVNAIKAFREGKPISGPEKYYVPVRDM